MAAVENRCRIFVLLVLFAVGCDSPSPDALYLAGDFVAARQYYNKSACLLPDAALPKEECLARAAEIDRALEQAVGFLGSEANRLVSSKRPVQFRDFFGAMRRLKLAVGMMGGSDPRRQEYQKNVELIETTLGQLDEEYEEQYAKLAQLLTDERYPPEVWREIRRTFERLRVLRMALRKQDDRPTELALSYVDKLQRAGRYERARNATELAQAVERVGSEFPTREQLSDKDLLRFAFIRFRAEAQQKERLERIGTLVAEVDEALAAGQKELAADKAGVALELEPDKAVAERLRRVLGSLEGESKRHRRELTRIAETVATVPPVTTALSSPAPSGASQKGHQASDLHPGQAAAAAPSPTAGEEAQLPITPEVNDALDRREMERSLAELTEAFEAGHEYKALVDLEALIVVFDGSPYQKRALRLQKLWEPDRRRLLRDIVQDADRLFVEMNDDSLNQYERALKLNPEGEVRAHVEERLDTLARILKR